MQTNRFGLGRVLFAAVVIVAIFPLVASAAVTEVGAGVRLRAPGESMGDGWHYDSTHTHAQFQHTREQDPDDPTAWYGSIDGEAKAHAVTRELKAYADLAWQSHGFELDFESSAYAKYDETIQVVAPEGYVWGGQELRIAFEFSGSTSIPANFEDFWNRNAYSSLEMHYSLDPELEPMWDQATLDVVDENGLVYFYIGDYAGEAIGLNLKLNASIVLYDVLPDTNYAEVDLYNTATYHSLTVLEWGDTGPLTVASFDGSDNLTAGDPGWAVVPEPATLSLLALGGLAMIRRRTRRA